MRKSKWPTLDQLRVLLVASRTQSLGAAARELKVRQPTISQCVRDRGMLDTTLTFSGRRLAIQAQRVIEEYDRLLSLIAKLAQAEAQWSRRPL